jgi:hypothetical protein
MSCRWPLGALLLLSIGACGGSAHQAPPAIFDSSAGGSGTGGAGGGSGGGSGTGGARDGASAGGAGPASDGAAGTTGDAAPGKEAGGADTAASADVPGGTADAAAPADTGAGADAAVACKPAGACDPFSTTSCAAGEVCIPNAVGGSSATGCVKIANATRTEDQPCGGAMGECGPGLLCLIGPKGQLCHRMCAKGSVGFCGGEKRCSGTVPGETCVQVCLPRRAPCDIYTQNCASPTEACNLDTDLESGAPYTSCWPDGTRKEDETCLNGAGACAKGLICVRTAVGGPATCHKVCKPDGQPACNTGKQCTGLTSTHKVTFCL